MKKILSLILAISLVVGLLPTFALAADGDITISFLNTTITTATDAKTLYGTNYTTVADETTANGNSIRFFNISGISGRGTFHFAMREGGASQYKWLDSKGSNAKWTIEIPVETEGYYKVKLDGATWINGAAYYIYVDGQYAGIWNSYDAAATDITRMPIAELNTVKITPVDGKAKVMFAYAGAGNRDVENWIGRMLIQNLILSPVAEYDAKLASIEHNFKTEMNVGDEPTDITAYAKMSDGTQFRTNGYTAARTEDANNNFKVEILENADGAIELANKDAFGTFYIPAGGKGNHTEFDGVYRGTLKAVAQGTAKIKITAKAGADDEKTEIVTIKVTDPEAPVVLKFNSSTVGNMAYKDETLNKWVYNVPSDWVIKDIWEIVSDKTYASGNTSSGSNYIRVPLRPESGSANWTVGKNNGSGRITVRAKVLEGWYAPEFAGATFNRNCLANVYVGGKFVGNFDGYDAAVTKDGNVVDAIKLNPVYVTPDENGYVEIALANADWAKNDNYYFTLSSMTLTPIAEESVPVLSSVECAAEGLGTIPDGYSVELPQDASVNVSAKVKLSDGTVYKYNGLNFDETADKTVSVSVSGDSVRFDNTTNVANEELTGTLTAVAPGTSTITVTAKIGDMVKTTSVEVTVPGASEPELPGEEADGKVSLYVAAENGGSVSVVGGNGNLVDEIDIGTKITAKANDVDGKSFSYWRNAAGKFVSSEKSYAFVANTNTSLIAVYDEAAPSDDTIAVSFFNQHKALIGSKKVAKGTLFSEAKTAIDTSLTGYVFDKWSIDDDTVISDITRAVALYNVESEVYNAYFFDGNDTTPASVGSGKYSDEVSYTAKGDNFAYWTVADGSNRIVSYDKTVSFRLWTTIALKAVYNEECVKVPTIVLDKQGDAYFIAYTVPEGYTAVSAGIVFSKSGKPEVNACYSRAVSENVSAQGQFTAKPSDDESVARGYIMFKDNATGSVRVIYAE